jgi:phosphoribosylglycinamide formyltransferase 1
MRILSPLAVRAFEGRILNVHPSLLPAFPGAHAVRDALAWGVKVTGCTVHLVDEEVDHGPIVAQEAVAVLEDDDEATLHARIQEVEHRLYPATVAVLLDGNLSVDGRRVVADSPTRPTDRPG